MRIRFSNIFFVAALLLCFSCSKKDKITSEKPDVPDPIDNSGSEYISSQNIKV